MFSLKGGKGRGRGLSAHQATTGLPPSIHFWSPARGGVEWRSLIASTSSRDWQERFEGEGRLSKSKGEQGRRRRGRARPFYFRFKKLGPRTHTTLARCSAFRSGAVSSPDDLWCENSISAPLFYSRTLFLSSFFLRRRGSLARCKEARGGGGGIEERQTDGAQRPPPSSPPPPAITSLLCFMANLQPMDRREAEGETGGQQLKGGAAAFIYIAKWPCSAKD